MNQTGIFLLATAAFIAAAPVADAQIPAAQPPYTTPQQNGELLARMLTVAKHNNLADTAFTQSVFGPNAVAESNGRKTDKPVSALDLTGTGPITAKGFTYHYITAPVKSPMNLWHKDDMFVGEFALEGIDKFICINGKDVSNVFRADPDVGLVAPDSHVFHVAQGANMVTEIAVSGPVEGDEAGCIKSLTIREHKMAEFVPSAAGGQ